MVIKKIINGIAWVVLIIILALIAFILIGMVWLAVLKTKDQRNDLQKYIGDVEYVQWVDEENNITLRQVNKGGEGYGTIEMENNVYNIYFYLSQATYMPNDGEVYLLIKFINGAETAEQDNLNIVSLSLYPITDQTDNIIGMQTNEPVTIWGKEIDSIKLTPVQLDKSIIRACEAYIGTVWADKEGKLQCESYQLYMDYTVTKVFNLANKDGAYKMYFNYDNTFKIENVKNGANQVVASGTYTDDSYLQVTLNFDKNELFEGMTTLTLFGSI